MKLTKTYYEKDGVYHCSITKVDKQKTLKTILELYTEIVKDFLYVAHELVNVSFSKDTTSVMFEMKHYHPPSDYVKIREET